MFFYVKREGAFQIILKATQIHPLWIFFVSTPDPHQRGPGQESPGGKEGCGTSEDFQQQGLVLTRRRPGVGG